MRPQLRPGAPPSLRDGRHGGHHTDTTVMMDTAALPQAEANMTKVQARSLIQFAKRTRLRHAPTGTL